MTDVGRRNWIKKKHGESIYELRAAQLGFYWLDSRGSSPGSTLMLTLMSSFLLLPWFDLIYSGGARGEIATTNPIQASFEASSAYYQVVRKSIRIHLKTMTSYRHPLHHFQAQEYTIPVILCVSIINFYETIKLHLIFVYFRLSRHFEQFPDHSKSAPRRLRANKVGFCGYFQLWSYVQIRFGVIHLQETPWRWRRLWKFLLHFWQGIERNLCVAGTWSCRRKWHGSPAGCISGIRWIFRQPSPQRQGPTEDAIELSSSSVFFFDVGRGGRGRREEQPTASQLPVLP